jgi:prepilin-type N-terminal cleavage/methylation domain-containing protein
MKPMLPCLVIASRAQPGVAIHHDGLRRRRRLPASHNDHSDDPHHLSCAPALSKRSASNGFTLVELLVGMSLALMVMTAVLSTYTTLGRSFTRSLGVSSANQPTLEGQARWTLATFAQDVRMASGLTVISASPTAPTSSRVDLIVPSGTGNNLVTYYYNSTPISGATTSDNVTINGSSIAMRREALTRCFYNGSTVTSQLLHANLLTCTFSYYDSSGNAYSASDLTAKNYLVGIKQLSLGFTAQAGSATNGTLTQVYQTDSPRLLLRNRSLLP